MNMTQGTSYHSKKESPIFEDISLYSIEKTKTNRVIMLHRDGSISALVEFQGVNSASFGESNYNHLINKIENVIRDTDDDCISTQLIMVREAADPTIDTTKIPSFLRPRADFKKTLAENNKLFTNKFYLSVFCKAKMSNKNEGMMKKAVRLYKKYIKKEYEQDDKRLEYYQEAFMGLKERTRLTLNTLDQLKQMIDDIGGTYRQIKTKQECYDVLQKFTRPSSSREGELRDPKLPELGRKGLVEIDRKKGDIPRKSIFSGVRVEHSKYYFTLDDYYHKIFTLDRAPQLMVYGHTIDCIESVPFEFIYSVTFRKKKREESLATLKFHLGKAIADEGSDQGSLVPDFTLRAKRERIEREYEKFAEQEGVGVDVSANFVLRVKEDYILKRMREFQLSREEVLRIFDQELKKNVFMQFGGSEWVNEPHTGWRVFSKILPGMSDIFHTYLKTLFVTAKDLPYFLALYDNKRDLPHNGTNYFVDLRGTQVNFFLMDTNMNAWNYSISGQTGSGKSVLVNTILTFQFAETKPIVCILDVGGDRGSYTKFMRLVNGTQINLSGVMKPTIQMMNIEPELSIPTPSRRKEIVDYLTKNYKDSLVSEDITSKSVQNYFEKRLKDAGSAESPQYKNNLKRIFREIFNFEMDEKLYEEMLLKVGQCEPSPKVMNLLLGCLEVMLSNNAKKQLDGFDYYDKDEISEIILETYRIVGATEKRVPYFSDLVNIAKGKIDNNEPMARKMITKLKNWTKDGTYSYFDQDTSIDMDNDVILADLKGLEDYPELQMIYTMLISELFNHKMYFSRGQRKLIIRDEAWSLMSNERARKYFVEDLRTARKNGFATIAISQLPTDYLQPNEQEGRAIISNFQVNVFCKFSTESICREIGAEYKLSEAVVEQMTELGVQRETMPDGSRVPTHSRFMMLVEESGKKSVYVLKNLLHPFEYMLYSSSAQDNDIIQYYMDETKQFEDLEALLWFISNKQHYGDEGLIEFLEKCGHASLVRDLRKQLYKKK